MKRFIPLFFFILLIQISFISASNSNEIKRIVIGNKNAKISIIAYESLTCSHCANFHTFFLCRPCATPDEARVPLRCRASSSDELLMPLLRAADQPASSTERGRSSCLALCSTLRSCARWPLSARFLAAQRRHRILLQHC